MARLANKRVFATPMLKKLRETAGITQPTMAEICTKLLNKSISPSLYQKIEQGKAGVLILDAGKIIEFWRENKAAIESIEDPNPTLFKDGIVIKRNGKVIE